MLEMFRESGFDPESHHVDTEKDYLVALGRAPDFILSDCFHAGIRHATGYSFEEGTWSGHSIHRGFGVHRRKNGRVMPEGTFLFLNWGGHPSVVEGQNNGGC